MAENLQIKRCWFHADKLRPHYDVPKRRVEEILNHPQVSVVSDRQISRLIKSQLTQEVIDETLNSAVENGYDLNGWQASELADDITDYSSQYEGIDPTIIAPYILDWQRRQVPV